MGGLSARQDLDLDLPVGMQKRIRCVSKRIHLAYTHEVLNNEKLRHMTKLFMAEIYRIYFYALSLLAILLSPKPLTQFDIFVAAIGHNDGFCAEIT
jgi:hypothetical protein